MSISFSRTIRSLEADGSRAPAIVAVAALVTLGAWGAWFFGTDVPVFEVSRTARLETDRETHFVDMPLDGRVIATRLSLGEEVEAGQLLVELDVQKEALGLVEDRALLRALQREREPLQREIAAEEEALRQERLTASAALDESRALAAEAEAARALSTEQAQRTALLHTSGSIAEAELARTVAEQRRQEAVAAARRLAVSRTSLEARSRFQDRVARLERLRGDRERLDGRLEALHSAIRMREYRIEQHSVRAPVSGRLTQVISLPPGSFAHAGSRIATIVPTGDIRVVAQFPPAALGRVRVGQPARLRLEGFSWTEYGTLAATVTAVASDAPGDVLRVQLRPARDLAFSAPIEHGLPGTAEVEVERVSPAALVMRSAGKLLGTRAAGAPELARAGTPP